MAPPSGHNCTGWQKLNLCVWSAKQVELGILGILRVKGAQVVQMCNGSFP